MSHPKSLIADGGPRTDRESSTTQRSFGGCRDLVAAEQGEGSQEGRPVAGWAGTPPEDEWRGGVGRAGGKRQDRRGNTGREDGSGVNRDATNVLLLLSKRKRENRGKEGTSLCTKVRRSFLTSEAYSFSFVSCHPGTRRGGGGGRPGCEFGRGHGCGYVGRRRSGVLADNETPINFYS